LALVDVAANKPGSAFSNRRRPLAEHSVSRARVDRNLRYRDENIILLDMDLPDRTTEDYAAPHIDPLVQVPLRVYSDIDFALVKYRG
jgi:kinesin family protein 3/17